MKGLGKELHLRLLVNWLDFLETAHTHQNIPRYKNSEADIVRGIRTLHVISQAQRMRQLSSPARTAWRLLRNLRS